MAKSKSEILDDVQAFVAKHGGKYKEWYVGTAEDPKSVLFSTHKFKNGDKGLYREAMSEIQAAEVAEFFIGQGAKGHGGVKSGADCVYAYKMAQHTKP